MKVKYSASENVCLGRLDNDDIILDGASSEGMDFASEGEANLGKNVAKLVYKQGVRDRCLPFKKRKSRKECELEKEEICPPLTEQIGDQTCKLGHMEKTLTLVYKKLKLHEDNIDMLQEKLYLLQFGTPGTLFAIIRYYYTLFKCTILPILFVELFYQGIYGSRS